MRVHHSYATVHRARIISSIFATKIFKQKRMPYVKATITTSSALSASPTTSTTVSSSAETSKSTKHASNLLVYKNIVGRQSQHTQKGNSTDKETKSSDSIKQPELALLLSWRKIFTKRSKHTKKQNKHSTTKRTFKQEKKVNSSTM